MYATPRNRASVRRSSATKPTTQMGISKGYVISNWAAMYCSGESDAFKWAIASCSSVHIGNPCTACQRKFGNTKIAATNTPPRNQGVKSARRCGKSSSATTIAAAKKIALYLLSTAMPRRAPTASHQRGSAPLTMRKTQSAASGQRTRPTTSVVTFEPKLINTGVNAATSAANACANAPPPNSSASKHVTYTDAAAQSAGMARSRKSECPKSCEPAAKNGTRGGWSTYPQSGRNPQIMK